jgi:hypothetical protein
MTKDQDYLWWKVQGRELRQILLKALMTYSLAALRVTLTTSSKLPKETGNA